MTTTASIADILHMVPSVHIDTIEYNEREKYHYEVDRYIHFGSHVICCNLEVVDDEPYVDNITFYDGEDKVELTSDEEAAIAKRVEQQIEIA